MVKLEGRKRRVDVEKLSDEELEQLSVQLSEKIMKVVQKANDEANAILEIYGLETLVQSLTPVPKGTLKAQKELE